MVKRGLRHALCGLLWGLALLAPVSAVWADELVTLDTRPNVKLSFWWMPRDTATATVVLFSGGQGGIGYRDGVPQSNNFLIRSRELFAAQGLNVIAVGNPSDQRALNDAFRTSNDHVADVRAILAWLKQKSSQPVWLVGTSRGTVSVSALGIAFSPAQEVAGLVLTASITAASRNATPIMSQDLAAIRLPTLVVHHEQDACVICPASGVSWVMRGLKNAPIKRYLAISGGQNPQGDACEALHWHGFIGYEAETIKQIADWLKAPAP